MTGTSRPDGVPPGWVSDGEFRADLAAVGCTVPLDRIAKWREAGLVPHPVQPAAYRDGRVSGSSVWHPPLAARQALAVQRLLDERSLYDFAGAVLWLAGASVPEKYWRPGLVSADANLLRFHRWFRIQTRERPDADDTFGDRAVSALGKLTGVIAKMDRRTPDGDLPLVFNIGSQIIAGRFNALAVEPHDEGDLSELELAERLMDFTAARSHHIDGAQFNFIGGLSQAFEELSTSINQFSLKDFSDDEIRCARDDVRNAFKLVVCHYEATKWIYGDQAFGLRMASWIATTATDDVFFVWVVLFARLRRYSNHFYSTAQIASLAQNAEATWLIATYFRDLRSNSQFAEIIDSKRWKLAFEDSHEMENLIKELAGYELPMPELRPWDQWKQLSGKTMQPGLLAMSIGAPNQVSLGAIQRDVSAVPNR